MDRQKSWLVVLGTVVALMVILLAWIGTEILGASRTTPGYQFEEARRRWAASAVSHYRMAAYYTVNWGQCYYDVEVLGGSIVRGYSFSCISSAESKTLTVEGIFKNYERFATQEVCSPNGCYCEGTFAVRATYHPTLGYPQRITTEFRRSTLSDILNGKWGVQECLRTDPVIEEFEVVEVTPLP